MIPELECAQRGDMMVSPTARPASALNGIVKQSGDSTKLATAYRPKAGPDQEAPSPAVTGCAVASAVRERN